MGAILDAYKQAKQVAERQRPGAILLMRLGDFYEAFGADAETMAEVCGIGLMERAGLGKMAGIPAFCVEDYVAKIVKAGYSVALAEPNGQPGYPEGNFQPTLFEEVTR
jgi:DNA mismatch repair protein MutS